MSTIQNIEAMQILDSRGTPTVEVMLKTDKAMSNAKVPSGASTGEREALELRDGDLSEFNGKGVLKAVGNVQTMIKNAVLGMDVFDQKGVDNKLIELDVSPQKNKGDIGANATLGVSLAVARAAAQEKGVELFQYLNPENPDPYVLPVPLMNILNGGKHAKSSNIELQEFMIAPAGFNSFSEALRAGVEIYQKLKEILKGAAVGDEGGFAPALTTNEDALELIKRAVGETKYKFGEQIFIALDPAASEFYDKDIGKYRLKIGGKLCEVTSAQLKEFYESLIDPYHIISIEDGFDQNDWAGWIDFTKTNGSKIQIIGDDLFVTNVKYLKKGIEEGAANAILIKPNQIGTLSETIATINMAKKAGMKCIISHRSGETSDTTIADLAVAFETGQIKTGAPCRSERTEKYNRLLHIEKMLGEKAVYKGLNSFK